jgi:hypothetical protein
MPNINVIAYFDRNFLQNFRFVRTKESKKTEQYPKALAVGTLRLRV